MNFPIIADPGRDTAAQLSEWQGWGPSRAHIPIQGPHTRVFGRPHARAPATPRAQATTRPRPRAPTPPRALPPSPPPPRPPAPPHTEMIKMEHRGADTRGLPRTVRAVLIIGPDKKVKASMQYVGREWAGRGGG